VSGAVKAYIGLGSNLADPRGQLALAIAALGRLPSSRLLSVSAFYRSHPMGPQDQPDYLNAVAKLQTTLAAEALLDALQAIEQSQGRVRERRWGPRTLDLDLLLYGVQRIDTPRLQVPHPGLLQRNFVLYPLQELEPDLVFPSGESIKECIASCSPEGLERLDNP